MPFALPVVVIDNTDNEAGKGDHVHGGAREGRYAFSTPEKLIADFQRGIRRWNHENRDA
jgi:hypothetical protein